MWTPNEGMVFGGTADGSVADRLRKDTDTGTWLFHEIHLDNLVNGAVVDCVADDAKRIFLMGVDDASTGIFDLTDPAVKTMPGSAFTPLSGVDGLHPTDGPVLWPLGGARVWIAGGVHLDAADTDPERTTLILDLDDKSIVETHELARPSHMMKATPWFKDGWLALACGHDDASQSSPTTTIELHNPDSLEMLGPYDLDMPRAGCAITGLHDGTLLITGGDVGDADPSAAILLPWDVD
jgi:hypothetical protein